jgi:catecholate siderophore receptor
MAKKLSIIETKNNNTYATVGIGSLAFAISGALTPGTSVADEEEKVQVLDTIEVEASLDADENPYAVKDAPYLSDKSGDPRRTLPLSKTPATINVLTGKFIADSGDTDLRDILDAQPGITLGTGEGGNSFGDRYIIRGHEARSDVFVDGLRDPGMTTRESFASEQVEISKGPSATFAGRGTTGGAVNSISKRASTEHNFTLLTGSLGTDNMHRLTVDHNAALSDDIAIRLNGLHASEDVPDREPADKQRVGLAGSFIYEPTDELDVTLDLYHLKADEKSDLGVFYDRDNNNKLASKDDVPSVAQDDDFLDSEINTATLRIGYEFDPDTRLTNLTRMGNTKNDYIITAANGFTTAYPTQGDSDNDTNGYDTIQLETKTRWQDLDYFANQLNFQTTEELAGIGHEMMFTLEATQYDVVNGNGYTYDTESNCFNSRGGQNCGTDANGNGDSNAFNRTNLTKTGWRDKWSLDTVSVSAIDSVYLTDQTTLHLGVRYDHYDYSLTTAARTDRFTGEDIAEQNYELDKGVWNGHLGLGYDITPDLNLYAIHSTASNLNGGESDVGTSSGYGGFTVSEDDQGKTVYGEDEKVKSYELGAKWMLNDGRLLATAALFRTVKDDVVEGDGYDPNIKGDSPNTGKNQVQGIEFGLSGNVNDRLSVQAGIAFMESEVLKTRVYEQRDRITGRLTGQIIDTKGQPLANFAETSAFALVKYQLTPDLSIGGSATYEGKRYNGQPDTGVTTESSIPAYTVYDAFVDYHIKKYLSVRLNVNNLTDEEYYTAGYRSGKFVYLGDARNANLTVNYKF